MIKAAVVSGSSKTSRMISAILSASSSSLSASIKDRPFNAFLNGSPASCAAPVRKVSIRLGQSPVASIGTRASEITRRRASISGKPPDIYLQSGTSPRSMPIVSIKFLSEFCGCCGPTSPQASSGTDVFRPGRITMPSFIWAAQRMSWAEAPKVPVEPAMMTGY